MKVLRLVLPLVLALGTLVVRADEPLYRIELKSAENCEFLSDSKVARIVVFPLSAGFRRNVASGPRPALAAADYDVSVRVRTTDPKQALSRIVRAISEQTGRRLFGVDNTELVKAAPAFFRTAFDRNSTWFLALTPTGAEENTYQLTCSFVLDNDQAPPEGPAPAAK